MSGHASNPEFESKIVRGQPENSGQFAAKPSSEPEMSLNAVNEAHHRNGALLLQGIGDYLKYGMPARAHRVTFEYSDQGDYLAVAEAFDEDGLEVDLDDDEDYDHWGAVNDVIRQAGDPSEYHDVRDLFSFDGGKTFSWTREHEFNEADEQLIRERIEKLAGVRRHLGAASQQAAISTIRGLLPGGYEKVVFTWSEQGPFLSLDRLVAADGSEARWGEVDEVTWDELEMAASDIRNVPDAQLRQIDDRGNYFELRRA